MRPNYPCPSAGPEKEAKALKDLVEKSLRRATAQEDYYWVGYLTRALDDIKREATVNALHN